MAVPEQKLKTLLTTFDCKFGKWSEINSVSWIKCPKFLLLPGEEFYFDVTICSQQFLCVEINRSSLNSTLFHCKVCLIDRFGQDQLTKRVSVTFQPNRRSFRLANWDKKFVNSVIREEDQLIIRCNLFVGYGGETRDCGLQTESPLFTETVANKFLSTLSSDLERLFDSKTNTDFVLKVGDIKFPVHGAVLSARSVVFAAMLKHDTTENTRREADIEDIEANTLSDVLLFVYSGAIRLTSDTAISIFTAADKYALLELREECLKFLLRNLTLHNICEAALLAQTHGEVTLESEVVCFIDANIVEVLDSDEWIKFSTDKPSLAIKIVSATLRKRATT